MILRDPSLCPLILGRFSGWNSLCRKDFNEGRQHVCNFNQLIHDIRYACLIWLLGMKVEIYQLLTLPISLRTSSPTSGGPLAPSGLLVHSNWIVLWSETTLNYWMMLEKYPNLKEEVVGSIPDCEISSPLDRKVTKWSIASCALVAFCLPTHTHTKKTLIVWFPHSTPIMAVTR